MKMALKKKSFEFLVVAGVTLFVLCLAAPSKAKVVLRYSNFSPPGSFPCVQMDHWAAEIAKRTDGEVTVQTFPGATLLSSANTYDGIVSGVADLGVVCSSYQPGLFPVTDSLDLPWGWPSAKISAATAFDLIAQYKPKEWDKVKIVTLCTSAPTNLMAKKPIKTRADLQRYELRAAGAAARALEILGATVVSMPNPDSAEALQKGVVKGNFTPIEAMKTFKLEGYCKFITKNINLFVNPFIAIMNKKKFESLSPKAQKVIDDLARENSIWIGQWLVDDEVGVIEWAKKQGVAFYDLAPDERNRWLQAVSPAVDEYIQKMNKSGFDGKKIINDLLAIKKKNTEIYSK